jgi:chromosome segregation ATPase
MYKSFVLFLAVFITANHLFAQLDIKEASGTVDGMAGKCFQAVCAGGIDVAREVASKKVKSYATKSKNITEKDDVYSVANVSSSDLSDDVVTLYIRLEGGKADETKVSVFLKKGDDFVDGAKYAKEARNIRLFLKNFNQELKSAQLRKVLDVEEGKLADLTKSLNETQNKLNEQKTSIANKQAEIKRLQQETELKIKNLNAEIGTLQTQVSATENEQGRLKKAIDDQQKKVDELNSQ